MCPFISQLGFRAYISYHLRTFPMWAHPYQQGMKGHFSILTKGSSTLVFLKSNQCWHRICQFSRRSGWNAQMMYTIFMSKRLYGHDAPREWWQQNAIDMMIWFQINWYQSVQPIDTWNLLQVLFWPRFRFVFRLCSWTKTFKKCNQISTNYP